VLIGKKINPGSAQRLIAANQEHLPKQQIPRETSGLFAHKKNVKKTKCQPTIMIKYKEKKNA
jgi:hypothetical protein